jgi:outer membrane lipoprotein-sorting protein
MPYCNKIIFPHNAAKGAATVMRYAGVLVLLIGVAAAYAFTEPAVCKRIRQQYNPETALRAEFDLSIYWKVREKTSKSHGMFTCAPGNRFRVETGSETYVSDGSVCWQYSRTNNQVVIRPLSQFNPSTLPSRVLSTALDDYRFSEQGRTGGLVTLIAQGDSVATTGYRSVKLDVRESDGTIETLEAIDGNGNIHTYRFKKTVFRKPADSATFTFEAPTDANVIDHRR